MGVFVAPVRNISGNIIGYQKGQTGKIYRTREEAEGQPGTYYGSQCKTATCVGHRTGARWARANPGRDCENRVSHRSFDTGCKIARER